MDDDDPLQRLGLKGIDLRDRAVFDAAFASLRAPISDYTFSQLFTWRNSLRIAWSMIDDHVCVFANGTGDLTLLMPPIGPGSPANALSGAFELMDAYNEAHGVPDRSRVEYVSEELLPLFDGARVDIRPLGGDYVYDMARMIDLAGGDLASKRQAKNRFARNYTHAVESYDPAKHESACLALLASWRQTQDAKADDLSSATAVKRLKESLAAELTVRHARDLGLAGMVVYAGTPDEQPAIRGFTFGEHLGTDQASIVVEKTDLACKGLAQFIFSEFCRLHFADRPLCNVGDDWGVQNLAWTKQSYRPIRRIAKYVLRRLPATSVAVPTTADTTPAVRVRPAELADVSAAGRLETACFDTHRISCRQLRYLRATPSAVFLVAEAAGQVVGDAIGLVRRSRRGATARIYTLAVDSDHRGRQIGRRLVEELLRRLADHGASRIYLEVDAANSAAIRLYEDIGFKRVGTLDDYYGPGRPGYHMRLDPAELPPATTDANKEACPS